MLGMLRRLCGSATPFAVALALSLMAKPMLVTWPFVLLLLDYWPLRRYQWRPGTGTAGFFRGLVPLVREKLPLFCLVVASMVITYVAESNGGAVRTFCTGAGFATPG